MSVRILLQLCSDIALFKPLLLQYFTVSFSLTQAERAQLSDKLQHELQHFDGRCSFPILSVFTSTSSFSRQSNKPGGAGLGPVESIIHQLHHAEQFPSSLVYSLCWLFLGKKRTFPVRVFLSLLFLLFPLLTGFLFSAWSAAKQKTVLRNGKKNEKYILLTRSVVVGSSGWKQWFRASYSACCYVA